MKPRDMLRELQAMRFDRGRFGGRGAWQHRMEHEGEGPREFDGPGGRGGPWGRGGRPGGPPFGGRSGRFGGPPFAGFGGRRFGHGPHVGRGDVRTAVLALLAEQPMHGYQVIQQITERSDGLWRPSPGSVYPALQLLEDEGLIRAEQSDSRRVFQLTDSGRAYAEAHRKELNGVWTAVTDTVDGGMLELFDLAAQLAVAVRQVTHAGTEAQIGEAKKLLINTRRQLYRILAEGEPVAGDRASGDAATTL